MGTLQYRLGKQHALKGIRALAHRVGRRYDSEHANESYINGYSAGCHERYEKTKKVGLDYSQPLNNQVFKP